MMLAVKRDAPKEPTVVAHAKGLSATQEWDFPTDVEALREFLSYVFATYWSDIIYGPLIDGAAYELTCPCAPTDISYSDGYLTVGFDGPHFHICLDAVTAAGGRERRAPSKARIFRHLDRDGAPVSWGFDMKNGAEESMMSIFFATPFVTNASILETEPKWERLAMWRDISARYLNRAPEAFDASGAGYTRRTS